MRQSNKPVFLNWKGLLLWSNHFYGICTTLLTIEASSLLWNKIPSYYALSIIYFGTVVYYTFAYLRETQGDTNDERSSWYHANKRYLMLRQAFLIIGLIYIAFFKLDIVRLFFLKSLGFQCLLLFSCLLSFFYYLPNFNFKKIKPIRQYGVLKSVSIAWVWATTCCLFPLLFLGQNESNNIFPSLHFLLFLTQLFVFILLLAILFDIKDLTIDKEALVNTLVLKYGVQQTIKKFAMPLIAIYFIISVVIYYLYHQTVLYLCSQVVLVLTIYFVISVIKKVKSIHYNILYIDGLMIVKALIGIVYASYY